jgi:DnaJ-class molecular chaperone
MPGNSPNEAGPERSIVTPKIKEHICAACNGTGFPKVKQPVLATHKVYPARCEACAGKGRIADD